MWSPVFRGRVGFWGLATWTLALAVGVNLVVFSIVNALWLRPAPFVDADRVVTLPNTVYTVFTDVEEIVGPGGMVAGQVSNEFFGLHPRLTFGRVTRNLEVLAVSHGYFRLLGIPIRGRDFTPDDDRPGAEPVAIISDRLWAREFGRRADVIGDVIRSNPVAVRVIGVAPPGFEGSRRGERGDIWIPGALVPRVVEVSASPSSIPMVVFIRMAPGQTAADIERRFREKYCSATSDRWTVVPLKDVYGTPSSPSLVVNESNALAVVGGLSLLVLIGGCATLAALVLVHYERRRSEFAVKVALGAPRGRLVGELARDLAVVAAMGTVGAVLIALLGTRIVPAFALPGGVDVSRLDLSIDWRVWGAALAATTLTLSVSAWLPISRFTHRRLAGELLAAPTATASAGSLHLRQALLALLVCATIVVMVSAGLFVRAVAHGFGAAPGFAADRTVFVRVLLAHSIGHVHSPETLAQWTTQIREALRSVPDVEVVADGLPPIDPLRMEYLRKPMVVQTHREQHEVMLGRMNGGPSLPAALGLPILAGRDLTEGDEATHPLPAIVTASLALKLWPGETPLGQVVSGNWRSSPLQIVGVVPDFAFGSLVGPAAGVVITAQTFNSGVTNAFVVRARDPDAVAARIPAAVRAALPDVSVTVSTGREVMARDLGRQRLGAWFFSGFGLTTLVLGMGGVFGLVAYLAESRRREFGVRLALGATHRDLMRQGVAVALVPVSIGMAAGLLFAALVSRVFASLLTGLSPLDIPTYAAVGLAVLGAAASAAFAAAWRLRRVMPVEVLRAE